MPDVQLGCAEAPASHVFHRRTCCRRAVLFGLGFLFAPLWIVALFVPCFSVNTKDRGAAIACTVALCCLAAVVLLALFLPLALGGS